MKISQLIKISNDALKSYGDVDVVVDVEARIFNSHLVTINSIGMTMSDDDYKEDPSLLIDGSHGDFIIHVGN